jgi:hypothetical protein
MTHRLVYVRAADLDRWSCRPLDTVDVLDLTDRPVGRFDGAVIDRTTSRPVYVAIRRVTDEAGYVGFLVPVGDAWFDQTERAIRIDAPARERVRFEPDEFERMSPEEADAYERRVLAACCPEVGFHRDGSPAYGRHELFACPDWLQPAATGSAAAADQK